MTTTAEDESAILEQLERDVHETIEKLKSKATEFNTMTTGDKSQFTADLYRASEKQSRAKSEDSERSLKLFIADPSSAEELSAANSPTIATEGCIMDALLIESGGKSSKKKDDAETEGTSLTRTTMTTVKPSRANALVEPSSGEQCRSQFEPTNMETGSSQALKSSNLAEKASADILTKASVKICQIPKSITNISKQTITLKKMPFQPMPVAKILPKPSVQKMAYKSDEVNKTTKAPTIAIKPQTAPVAAVTMINTTSSTMENNHLTQASKPAPILIRVTATTMPATIDVPATTAVTVTTIAGTGTTGIPMLKQIVTNSCRAVNEIKARKLEQLKPAQLTSPKLQEVPIKPRIRQQLMPVSAPLMTTKQQQQPSHQQIAKCTASTNNTTVSPIISTAAVTSTSTIVVKSADSSVDLLTHTVNKVAAGAEISPNKEEGENSTSTLQKTTSKSKSKKKQPPKTGTNIGKEAANIAKQDVSNSISSPHIGTVQQQQISSNNSMPTQMLLQNQQFALGPNGSLVAVSSGGMTHYLIRQQPNSAGQFIPIMPSSQQVFLSPLQQIEPGKHENPGQQQASQQQPSIPNMQTSHQLMGGNVLYRSNTGGIFMPIQPQKQTQQNQQQQKPIQPRPTATILPKTTAIVQSMNNKKATLAPVEQQQQQQMEFFVHQQQPQHPISGLANMPTNKLYLAAASGPPSNGTAMPIQQANFIQMTSPPQITMMHHLDPANFVPASSQTAGESLHGFPVTTTAGLKTSPTKARRKKKSDESKNKLPPPSNTKQMPPALETNTSNDQIVDEEENEPPPILCRDEPSGTHSIESIFQKEAKIIREKMFDSNGKKLGPIVHEIDGFRIEEDVEPFPCEHQKLLERLDDERPAGRLTGSDKSSSKKEESSSPKNNDEKLKLRLPRNESRETAQKRRREDSSTSGRSSRSNSSKRDGTRKRPEKKKSSQPSNKKGRRRELEGLLKMDFGPGKTPFQTSDPDEYAEGVLIGVSKQQRTLALTAEERVVQRSVERPSSSAKTKNDNKDKSHSKSKHEKNQSPDEVKREEPNKKSPKTVKNGNGGFSGENESDEQEEHCSYCKRSFKEIGRDKDHKQYCSKECRKNLKKLKKLKPTSMDSNTMNTASVEREVSQRISSTPTRRSDPLAPGTSSEGQSPTQKTTMTSPLGSAFCTIQPQMLSTSGGAGRTLLGAGDPTAALKRKWTLEEQATQLAAAQRQFIQLQQQANQFAAAHGPEFRDAMGASPSSGGDQPQQQQQQMFLAGPPQMSMTPTAMQQMHNPHQQQFIQVQQKQQYPLQQHIAAPYLGASPPGVEGLHFVHPHQQQQQPQQLHHQLMMPSTSHFFANPFQLMQQQQAAQSAMRQPQLVQSPVTPATPITPLEKNAEIEALVTRGIQSWTPEEVARWVNFITNTETNGERFIQQEIDGSSLVLLTCEQLQNELKLKLGPAVKLNNALNALKSKSYLT